MVVSNRRFSGIAFILAAGLLLGWSTPHWARASEWLTTERYKQKVGEAGDDVDGHLLAEHVRRRYEAEERKEEREKEDAFIPGLEIELEIESAFEFSKNFDLDDDVSDDLGILEPEFTVSLFYKPVDWFAAKFEMGLIREFALLEEGKDEKRVTELNVDKANIKLKNLYGGLGLLLGRRKFEDERRWLYDKELDAVLLSFEAENLLVELSASRENLADRDLLNEDKEKERINNYILFADYQASDQIKLNGYVVARDDRTNKKGSPVLIGVRSTGTLFDHLDHLFEFAHVTGEDGDKDIRGIALDIAATYRLDQPLNPYLKLGYAFGSGDPDPDDDTDKAFRQTGLQKNEEKFAGSLRFKYYGEAFDPELSNMHIYTAGIGFRPSDIFSISFVYHYYRQDEIADELRDAAFTLEPNQDGTRRSRDLGSEIDVILGFREIFDVENLGVDLAVGYFFPGDAYRVVVDESLGIFKDADGALFARFEVEYAF